MKARGKFRAPDGDILFTARDRRLALHLPFLPLRTLAAPRITLSLTACTSPHFLTGGYCYRRALPAAALVCMQPLRVPRMPRRCRCWRPVGPLCLPAVPSTACSIEHAEALIEQACTHLLSSAAALALRPHRYLRRRCCHAAASTVTHLCGLAPLPPLHFCCIVRMTKKLMTAALCVRTAHARRVSHRRDRRRLRRERKSLSASYRSHRRMYSLKETRASYHRAMYSPAACRRALRCTSTHRLSWRNHPASPSLRGREALAVACVEVCWGVYKSAEVWKSIARWRRITCGGIFGTGS